MPKRFDFDENILASIVGGRSALDLPQLRFKTTDECRDFIKGYGVDLSEDAQVEKLWYYHRRALVLLTEKLGFSQDEIPGVLKDRKQLQDITQLLLFASSSRPQEKDLQRWSCALLRAMHVFVHAENDLFSSFSEEIQKQILSPFQHCLVTDGSSGTTFLRSTKDEGEGIALQGFEIKPFKTSSSTVIKLLAKPDAFAMSVFDKLGVRFITKTIFDTFRVIRFLTEENLISFPHIMADQSSNNLYPADLFVQVCRDLVKMGKDLPEAEIQRIFQKAYADNKDQYNLVRKDNHFSGDDYRFIKFISRRMVRVPGGLVFFYPYEVQLMDAETHHQIMSGPSRHQAYKDRQKLAARARVLPAEN